MYQIYTLSDPTDTSIRYVGMGQNAYRRYATHILNPGNKATIKDVWVQELLNNGKAPILNIIETVESRQEAGARERYWIEYYLASGTSLVNQKKIPHQKQAPLLSASTPATRRNMNLEQVKQFITDQGWTPQERPRRKGKLYLYATKRDVQNWRKRTWKYVAPVSRLEAMSEQEILAKLNK